MACIRVRQWSISHQALLMRQLQYLTSTIQGAYILQQGMFTAQLVLEYSMVHVCLLLQRADYVQEQRSGFLTFVRRTSCSTYQGPLGFSQDHNTSYELCLLEIGTQPPSGLYLPAISSSFHCHRPGLNYCTKITSLVYRFGLRAS